MSNMSYCRFHNTKLDFAVCAEVLQEMIDRETHEVLSRDELAAAQQLCGKAVRLVMALADHAGVDCGDLDKLERQMDDLVHDLNDQIQEDMETEEPEEGEETPTDMA